MNFKGVIFDLDGVITATASIHFLAWKAMFDDYLQKRSEKTGEKFEPFSEETGYLPYVDGKPRLEGLASYLEALGIDLPMGDPSDAPGTETINGLGNQKNKMFTDIIKRDGPTVFTTSVDLINQLKAAGLRVGVATSSRNCTLILETGKLTDLFETQVDGNVSAQMGLNGKPQPDIFITAAKNLGLKPSECVVVEDAISGVTAGKAGNFGMVLGVARNIAGSKLKTCGADKVVSDLGEISLDDIDRWFATELAKEGWTLNYNEYKPEEEKLREVLCGVGNGYFGNRAAFECNRAGEHNYPGTYVAGIYNKIPTKLHGRDIYNNDFVNCPNWTLIEFKVGEGPYRSPLDGTILSYRQTLNFKEGVMERTLLSEDPTGRITFFKTKRLASMRNPHFGTIHFTVVPVNYSGKVYLRSGIDGDIINDGVARYRMLNQQHLTEGTPSSDNEGIYLDIATTASNMGVSMAVQNTLYLRGVPTSKRGQISTAKSQVYEEYCFDAEEGETYCIEKVAAIYTSNDQGVNDYKAAAREALRQHESFDTLYDQHVEAMADVWADADIIVKGDRLTQQVLRLHIFHLLVTASPHNKNIDAGMTARGLHGEAYRGHIFWDELYIYPYYNMHFPEITRALLMYRYNRLPDARNYAKEYGYEGAMIPWQTADDGKEETQIVHFNPVSGEWDPDMSSRQRHVSIAVFFNSWSYVQHSGDTEWLHQYGAEMMLDLAIFWASISKYDQADGKYHIEGVMGPDEFHESLPGSGVHGLKDNAYTNLMVVWIMERALELIDQLPQDLLKTLEDKLKFNAKRVKDKWADISHKMNIIINDDGIMEQYDGYFGIKELDWDAYRAKYPNIHRMDRILKAEGDTPDNYKVAKQADTLMMFYLLAPEQVTQTLSKLGYEVGDAQAFLKKNYEYYVQRTSHGSTLSKVVHAAISGGIFDPAITWQWFVEALESDIYDSQGGTTPEGIHCGVMAGTLDIVHKNFMGISFDSGQLTINPNLPSHWDSVKTRAHFQKQWYCIEICPESARVELLTRSPKKTDKAIVNGQAVELKAGEAVRIQF